MGCTTQVVKRNMQILKSIISETSSSHRVWKSQEMSHSTLHCERSQLRLHKRTKINQKCQNWKIQMHFLGNFQTLCQYLIYDKKWPSAHFMLQRAEIPDINPLGCIINKQKSFNTSLALTWIILSPTWTKIVLYWQLPGPFSPDAFLFHLDALCLWHTPTLTQNNTPFIASRAYS